MTSLRSADHRPWQLPARPLPLPASPAPNELVASYVRRLAQINHIEPKTLLEHLGQGTNNLTHVWHSHDLALNTQALHRLATFAGCPSQILRKAMPRIIVTELDNDGPRRRWITFRHAGIRHWPRLICSYCAASRLRIGKVGIYVPPDLPAICLRHNRLLGYYTLPHLHELNLDAVPEIIDCYHRHRRIRRQYGIEHVEQAQRRAARILRSWAHPYRLIRPTEVLDRWRHRTAALAPHDRLADYPETVILTELLADPRWAAAADTSMDNSPQPFQMANVIDFRLQIGVRLKLANPADAVTKAYEAKTHLASLFANRNLSGRGRDVLLHARLQHPKSSRPHQRPAGAD